MSELKINKLGLIFYISRDIKDFNVLYYHLRNYLNSFIHLKNINNLDSKLLIDYVIEIVYNKIDKYNPRYAFSTWISTICLRKYLEMGRKEKIGRKEYISDMNREEIIDDTPEYNDGFDYRKEFFKFLSEIDYPFNEILLRKYNGEKYINICEDLGMNYSTMKGGLYRRIEAWKEKNWSKKDKNI